jgi:hypothetical protein
MTVTRRIRRRGERAISRKAIAQGMPDCLRFTCMLVCAFFAQLAHETAGAARIRHSLRPLIREGGQFLVKLARIMRRDREGMLINDSMTMLFEI